MTDKPEPGNRQSESERGLQLERLKLDLDKVQAYRVGASITRVGRVEEASFIVPEFWINLLGFVILEVAIAIGWIAAVGGHVNEGWKTVLIALAAAALGFGAAYLLARRSTDSQGRELERDYEELKERSKRVLSAIDQLEEPSRSSESGAPSGPAQ